MIETVKSKSSGSCSRVQGIWQTFFKQTKLHVCW